MNFSSSLLLMTAAVAAEMSFARQHKVVVVVNDLRAAG